MEIVKILKDYAKNPLQKELTEYFSQEFDSTICYEKIKNKDFMVKYLQPLNDFIIHTTAIPCSDARRMLYWEIKPSSSNKSLDSLASVNAGAMMIKKITEEKEEKRQKKGKPETQDKNDTDEETVLED